MKTIVETIQKEQNMVIRNSEKNNLIVQGVAGSGKTAIAMHRVAYLLYRLKGKITSSDIIMLSPNNAFSSYISNVLPDLAEDDIKKIQLDFIVASELKKYGLIERKFEQIERIIKYNEKYKTEFDWKISLDFYNKLKLYCFDKINQSFKPDDFTLFDIEISKNQISTLYFERYVDKDIFTKICWISEKLIDFYFYRERRISKINLIKEKLFEKLYSFIDNKNIIDLYVQFLKLNNYELKLTNSKIKNEDAFALLYIKYYIFGTLKDKIKHLVIDEMQDYSCVQWAIINYLYDCPKTILGDYYQSINSFNSKETFNNLSKILTNDIDKVELLKSYRPTKQICNFYNSIIKVDNLEVVNRDGENVNKIVCVNEPILNKLIKVVKDLKNKGFKSIAVITKTNYQAISIYEKINKHLKIQLIDDNIDNYNNEICIISVYNSKGLEFDAVVVYDVSSKNYNTELDRHLLFIASSRALHKLTIICKNDCSKFITNNINIGEQI